MLRQLLPTVPAPATIYMFLRCSLQASSATLTALDRALHRRDHNTAKDTKQGKEPTHQSPCHWRRPHTRYCLRWCCCRLLWRLPPPLRAHWCPLLGWTKGCLWGDSASAIGGVSAGGMMTVLGQTQWDLSDVSVTRRLEENTSMQSSAGHCGTDAVHTFIQRMVTRPP